MFKLNSNVRQKRKTDKRAEQINQDFHDSTTPVNNNNRMGQVKTNHFGLFVIDLIWTGGSGKKYDFSLVKDL